MSCKLILTATDEKASHLANFFFDTVQLDELRATTKKIKRSRISTSDSMILEEIFHIKEIQRRCENRYPGELDDGLGFHALVLFRESGYCPDSPGSATFRTRLPELA